MYSVHDVSTRKKKWKYIVFASLFTAVKRNFLFTTMIRISMAISLPEKHFMLIYQNE